MLISNSIMAFRPRTGPHPGPHRGIPDVVNVKFNVGNGCLVMDDGNIIKLPEDVIVKIKRSIGCRGGHHDSPVAGPADARVSLPRQTCRYKNKCNNDRCNRHHLNACTGSLAEGKYPNMRPCQDGPECKREGCYYNHKPAPASAPAPAPVAE